MISPKQHSSDVFQKFIATVLVDMHNLESSVDLQMSRSSYFLYIINILRNISLLNGHFSKDAQKGGRSSNCTT